MTPGAATEGVTPLSIFFPDKPGDLFLLIAVSITKENLVSAKIVKIEFNANLDLLRT